MSDFLKAMAQSSAERASRTRTYRDAELERPVVPLTPGAFDIIAEIKARSPAEGELADAEHDIVGRARRYAEGGAVAISVLTEPTRFDGALAHLDAVATALPSMPVMRKDFLVDPAQVIEARAAGASGVLLIVAMLSDRVLRVMLDRAAELGMFVLLEAFDEDDVDRMRRFLNPADEQRAADEDLLFGINSRNLRTLDVDPDRLGALVDKLPGGIAVAESGLATPEDAAAVARYGYGMALVGTALMRTDDPASLIADMRNAGAEALAA